MIRCGPDDQKEINTTAIEAVRREADNLRSVIHRNIIQCHGIVLDPGAVDRNGKLLACCVVSDLCITSLRRVLDYLLSGGDGGGGVDLGEAFLLIVEKFRFPDLLEKVFSLST